MWMRSADHSICDAATTWRRRAGGVLHGWLWRGGQGRYSTILPGASLYFQLALLTFTMANIHSQKKRILRAERERLENRRYTSTIKTFFRRLEAAVASGDDELAASEHRTLISTIDKAVKRGALHRNNGARKKSRAARVRSSSKA